MSETTHTPHDPSHREPGYRPRGDRGLNKRFWPIVLAVIALFLALMLFWYFRFGTLS